MNWMQVSASWREAKARIQRKWRKLTDDDLDLIDGRRERLERKILQLYGFAPDHVRKEVDDWVRWQALIRPRRSQLRSALAPR
ncbi:CsbD family protein [Pseudorhodoplanes sp.]|uniref:CsbD family protein n=1 Tax=Pseudorhodoplanes sp. TaxID=1934341 RepID=UPI003D0CFF52